MTDPQESTDEPNSSSDSDSPIPQRPPPRDTGDWETRGAQPPKKKHVQGE